MNKNKRTKGFAVPLLVGAIATAGALAIVIGGGTQMVAKLAKEATTKDTSNIYLKQGAFALTSETSDLDGDGVHEAIVMAANADGTGVCAGGSLVSTSTTACYIPSTSSAPKGDAWGSSIKYCSFDNGTTNTSAGRITGANPATGASITFALISAGPNKAFNTTCAAAASGTIGGDDVSYRFSGLQITQGVSGTQYWGDPVTNAAALASLDPAQQKDGETRVQKDTGQVHRFDTGTNTWKPTNGVTAVTGTGVGIGVATLPAATLHVDKGSAGEALRIGGTGDQSISFNGGPSIASSGNAVNMVLNASGQVNQLTLKNTGRTEIGGGLDINNNQSIRLMSTAGHDAYASTGYLQIGSTPFNQAGLQIDAAGALGIWTDGGGAWAKRLTVANTGLVTAAGTLKGAYLLPSTIETLGQACATNGTIAQSSSGASLSCVNGTWLAPGSWNLNAGGDQYNTNSSGAILVNTAVNDGTGAKLQVAGSTSITGNLLFNGAGRRITGSLSENVTDNDRMAFQSSTANGGTYLGAIPNGVSTLSGFIAYNNSVPNNGGAVRLGVNAVAAELTSFGALPITINPGGVNVLTATTTGLAVTGIISTTNNIYTSGNLVRAAQNKGYLDGNYLSGGEDHVTGSGPIYTIGGTANGVNGYHPTATTLGNMYGVGYAYTNAANSNGVKPFADVPTGNWGMYVAGNGVSTIFLNSDSGIGYFAGGVQTRGMLKVGGHDNQQTGAIALGNDSTPGYANTGIHRGGIGTLGGDNYLNVSGYAGIAFNSSAAAFGSQTTRMTVDGVTGIVNVTGALQQQGNQVLHAGNFSNYAISRTGDLVSGLFYFSGNKGAGSYLKDNNGYALQAYSSDGGAAAMSFHRGGSYAVNMGLDPDHVMRIGGWSDGANSRWALDNAGNEVLRGSSTATSFKLANGFQISQGPSNYGELNSWVHLPGFSGFYSAQNSAHIYPNNGSYGAWRISGSRGLWGGIEFDTSNGNVTQMISASGADVGWHGNRDGWMFLVNGGEAYIYSGVHGGGSQRRVLHAGDVYAANMNQYVRTTDAPTFAGLTINGSVSATAKVSSPQFDVSANNGIYAAGTNLVGVQIAGINKATFSSAGLALIDNLTASTIRPTTVATLGNACTQNGEIATTATGAPLACVSSVWSSMGGAASMSALTDATIAAPSSGQTLIYNATTSKWVNANLTGTANQVVVTNAAGSITLSLPQNIHAAATPTFAGATINGTLYNSYKGANSTGNNIWIGGGGQSSYAASGAVPHEGSLNTAIGVQALFSNTTGYYNTATGLNALVYNTTGYQNTANGMSALYSNTTGYSNTANGVSALYYNTTGFQNTATGLDALAYNTTGYQNTANGMNALAYNTTGYQNTANGMNALVYNTTGYQNTANGVQALFSNTTGSQNTATGLNALYSNTTGNSDTATGLNALFSNTTGYQNTATGLNALYSNTTGYQNTATGLNALYSNTTGYQNTANGSDALYWNTTGLGNTANGGGSLFSNTTGSQNTAAGYGALYFNTTGSYNAALGNRALSNCTTCSGNIQIGGLTAAGAYAPVFDFSIENNRIIMGSTAVTNAYVQVAWTVVSDARDKMNFDTVPHGLDFVRQLKPTSYQFKMSRNDPTPNGRLRYGFLAQDILALEGASGVIIDNTDPNKLRFNEADLIPVLVNSIQDLDRNLVLTRNKVDKVISDSSDWVGNVISVNKGGTGLTIAPGIGDILVGNGIGYSLSRLSGSANQISVTHDANGTNFALTNDVRVHGKLFAASLSLLADAQSITNAAPIDGALAKATALRGVYGDINGNRQPLFVAQDMEGVIPELIDINPEGLKTVGYSGVLPILVEAVKELHTKIGPLYPLAAKLSVLSDNNNTIRIDAPVLITGAFTAKTVTAEKVIADEVQGKTRVFSDAIERQIVGGGYADILNIPDQGAIVLNVSSPDGRSHLSASIINTGNTLKIASNMKDGFDLQAVGTQVRLVNTDPQTKNAKASWVRTQ